MSIESVRISAQPLLFGGPWGQLATMILVLERDIWLANDNFARFLYVWAHRVRLKIIARFYLLHRCDFADQNRLVSRGVYRWILRLNGSFKCQFILFRLILWYLRFLYHVRFIDGCQLAKDTDSLGLIYTLLSGPLLDLLLGQQLLDILPIALLSSSLY